MKNYSLAALCCFFLFSLTAFAQFEGQINLDIIDHESGKGEKVVVTTLIKGEMVATTIKGKEENAAKLIVRGDKQVLWVIDDEEKHYLELPLDMGNMAGMEEMMKKGKGKEKAADISVKKTGKTQTILGYPCEEWEAITGDEVVSVWGTTKLGNIYSGLAKSFRGMEEMQQKMGSSWGNKLGEMGVFPLKTTVMRKGKLVNTQEVTKLEERKLAASTFEAPAGYEKQEINVDMQKMMKQMQEQMMKKKD